LARADRQAGFWNSCRVLRETSSALRAVASERAMRGLLGAQLTTLVALWSFTVPAAVLAYDVGGASLVGLVLALKTVPAAIAAPLCAGLADRFPKVRVMTASQLVQAVLAAVATACVVADLAPVTFFAPIVLMAVASTAFDPAKNALMPSLVRDQGQLTAANAISNTAESTSVFLGPALGGALIALTSIELTMAACPVLLLIAVVQLRAVSPIASAVTDDDGAGAMHDDEDPERRDDGIAAGFEAVRESRALSLVIGLIGVQSFLDGLLSVLVVVVALELLSLGNAGVGLLDAAIGVGGLIAGGAAIAIGSRALARTFAAGMVLSGLPIVALGLTSEVGVVVALMALVGIGTTLSDVAGVTLLQRAAPAHVLGRVFGVLEGVMWATVGIGGLLAPLLITLLGVRGALVAVGLLLPVVTALAWPLLRALDAELDTPSGQLALLRGIPMLAVLPAATLEALASGMERLDAASGTEITVQGEPGRAFYVIAGGTVGVLDGDRWLRELGPGDSFGEIALLRRSPRTATVRATTDAQLYVLDGADFVAAVTGHAESANQAAIVVAQRLGSALRRRPVVL
jgi:MFS family permease